jgi:nucleoside-diphosphate-sugar epimerase
MNILIIGGSGFLSGTLAHRAVTAGHRVWTVTRGRRPQPDGVSALIADRRDFPAFEAALAEVRTRWDLVVDCIAYNADDIRQDVTALARRADHLVFISTDFVYDPMWRRFPQAEDARGYLADGYGGLKRQGELALAAAGTGGMAWTIFRPCHIYGPGSQLGCLPMHGRDPELVARLRRGEALRLVGGGHFLQQPVLAGDLARVILEAAGNPKTFGQTFNVAGLDIVESREYYQIIAATLGVPLKIEEIPVEEYRAAHPESAPFLCHRIYDLGKLAAAGITPPQTPLVDGLHAHVASLLGKAGA